MHSTLGFTMLKIIFIIFVIVLTFIIGEFSFTYIKEFFNFQISAAFTFLPILGFWALSVYFWDEHLSWR